MNSRLYLVEASAQSQHDGSRQLHTAHCYSVALCSIYASSTLSSIVVHICQHLDESFVVLKLFDMKIIAVSCFVCIVLAGGFFSQ